MLLSFISPQKHDVGKRLEKIQDGLIKSADQLSKVFYLPDEVEDYNNIRMENGVIEVTHSPTVVC